jgi:hypothetical protein
MVYKAAATGYPLQEQTTVNDDESGDEDGD